MKRLVSYSIGWVLGTWATYTIIVGHGNLWVAMIGFVVTCYFAVLIWRLK